METFSWEMLHNIYNNILIIFWILIAIPSMYYNKECNKWIIIP